MPETKVLLAWWLSLSRNLPAALLDALDLRLDLFGGLRRCFGGMKEGGGEERERRVRGNWKMTKATSPLYRTAFRVNVFSSPREDPCSGSPTPLSSAWKGTR